MSTEHATITFTFKQLSWLYNAAFAARRTGPRGPEGDRTAQEVLAKASSALLDPEKEPHDPAS